MKLLDQIQEDLKKALREKEKTKISCLRFLLAEIKNEEIARKKKGALLDEEIQEVISRSIKKHRDSIQSFKKGGRGDLVKEEEKEIEILQGYLPKQLSEDELSKIIDEVIQKTGAKDPSDFGKVMGQVMEQVKGRAEGKEVSEMVKKKLEK